MHAITPLLVTLVTVVVQGPRVDPLLLMCSGFGVSLLFAAVLLIQITCHRRAMGAYREALLQAAAERNDGVDLINATQGYRSKLVQQLSKEFLGVIQRTTAERNMDGVQMEKTQQIRRDRTLLFASMSHDLRSPLNAIRGFTSLLQRDEEKNLTAEQNRNLQQISRATAELIQLMGEVLDTARFELGKVKLEKTWVPAATMLTESIRRVQAYVDGQDVEIKHTLSPGLPTVHADAERIVQAIAALFRFSIRNLSARVVEIKMDRGERQNGKHALRIILRAVDVELPYQEYATLFSYDPALARFGVRPSFSRGGGLRMGLSLAQTLVRAHEGTISAEPVDSSTVFTILLPCDP